MHRGLLPQYISTIFSSGLSMSAVRNQNFLGLTCLIHILSFCQTADEAVVIHAILQLLIYCCGIYTVL